MIVGMEKLLHPTDPLPLNRAARCLQVPAGWLREEFEAGRVPGLRAGRVILLHVPTVATILAKRARQGGEGVRNGDA